MCPKRFMAYNNVSIILLCSYNTIIIYTLNTHSALGRATINTGVIDRQF